MSDIPPIQGPIGPSVTQFDGVTRATPADQAPQTTPAEISADRVELSDTARLLAEVQDASSVRQELVDQVRQQIDAGTYLTDEKIDAALDELLQDITEDLF